MKREVKCDIKIAKIRMSNSNDFFQFHSETKFKEGAKIIKSDTLWCISADLSTFSFTTGQLSREISLHKLPLTQSTDQIISIGFLIKYSKVFMFANFRQIPTLFILHLSLTNSNEIEKFSFLTLSSLHFHNNIYEVFCPFENSICVVSREGISIHSSNDLSVIFEKSAVFNPYLNCCFHKNVLAVTDSNSLAIYQFISKDQCKRLVKIKQDKNKFIPKQLLVNDNHLFLIPMNTTTKFVIKHICLSPTMCHDKTIESFILPNEDLKFSIYDKAILLSSSTKTVFVDFLAQTSVSFGELKGIPCSVFVNDNILYSYTNNNFYEFNTNYRSIPDPCSFELISAIMRRKGSLQIALEKLEIAIKKHEKVTSSTIDEIVSKIGTYATSPLEQIRFSQFLLYSGITNPHLILLAMIKYSKILDKKMIEEAKQPLFFLMTKDECAHLVPSLLASSNIKLDKKTMDFMLKANPVFYNLDISFFSDPAEFILACFESGRCEKAMDLLLREATRGVKNEKLMNVIKMYVEKKGDNIQRSYKKLLLSMTSEEKS